MPHFSLAAFSVISVAYIVSFSLMLGFVTPLQMAVLPELTQYVSLLFLPHGVRVLVIHYYGWRGIVYLMPSSALMWFVVEFGTKIDASVTAIIVSLLSCYVGVGVLRWITKAPEHDYQSWSWKMVLAAGAVCSVLNSMGLSFLYFDIPDPMLLAGYIVGDTAGMAVTMVALIYMFKLADKISGYKL